MFLSKNAEKCVGSRLYRHTGRSEKKCVNVDHISRGASTFLQISNASEKPSINSRFRLSTVYKNPAIKLRISKKMRKGAGALPARACAARAEARRGRGRDRQVRAGPPSPAPAGHAAETDDPHHFEPILRAVPAAPRRRPPSLSPRSFPHFPPPLPMASTNH